MQLMFGHYVLDPEWRELTRDARPIAVGPQVFDLLLYLVNHRAHVVSKDEVLDAVWDGRIVSDSTLTSHINAARKAIGDSGSKQELIRTVARKGFRFVGEVVELEPGSTSGGTREAIEEALPLFQEAIVRDPGFASAHAMAAWCYFWRKVNGWMTDGPKEIAQGAQLARRAVELGKDDAVALARAGHALAHLSGDLEKGIALLDRALLLNPNLAAAWFLGGFLKLWHGEADDAIARFTHTMRLSPLDPELYRMQAGMAVAHFFAGRIEDAPIWANKATREIPDFTMVIGIIAACHALSGRTDDARQAMDHLRRLYPSLRLSNLKEWLPIHRPGDLAALTDGLRKAGLPA